MVLVNILALASHSTLPTASAAVYADRKIGPWAGDYRAEPPAEEFVNSIFLTKPFYAAAMLHVFATDGDYTGGSNFALDVARIVKDKSQTTNPELAVVELYVAVTFDLTETNTVSWGRFQSFVDGFAQYKPIAFAVGPWGEFSYYGGINCGGQPGCANPSNEPLSRNTATLDRIKSIVEGKGLQFVGEGIAAWGVRYDSRYVKWGDSGVQGYPVWNGNTAWSSKSIESDMSPTVGAYAGVDAGYACCGGHLWTQADVLLVMSWLHAQRVDYGHFFAFVGPVQGGSGSSYGIIRDTIARDWIWQEIQRYPEFTWVGKPQGPKSYLDLAFVNSSLSMLQPGIVRWELYNGSQEISYTPRMYTLTWSANYTLKTYYSGYLIEVDEVRARNTTITISLSMYQHRAVPGGQLAFNKPVSVTLSEQTPETLSFAVNSVALNYLIVAKSPSKALQVQKNGTSFGDWFFDAGQNTTVIDADGPGTWKISFASVSPQQPQPPPFPFFPIDSTYFPFFLLLVGFALGILPFTTILLVSRTRNRKIGLDRIVKLSSIHKDD